MAKDMKSIHDKGYDAVRLMAKEMVGNGASLADILFHANQVWHEFKVGALGLSGVAESGLYIDQYNAEATSKILDADKNYTTVGAVLEQAQARKKSAKAGR